MPAGSPTTRRAGGGAPRYTDEDAVEIGGLRIADRECPGAGARFMKPGTHRILLADGDPKSLRVLDVSLRSAGFDVRSASTGTEAWAMLQESAPELIIADTQLAGIDGFELCARLRKNASTATVPFILLSADKGPEHRVRGIQAGADDYLIKPAYVNEVLSRARGLLQRRERERLNVGPGHERFRGQLADITVVDLLQLIEGNGRSGIVHLIGVSGAPGTIFFRHGKVVDAEVGRLSGMDALSRLFSWTAGTFEIEWKSIRRADSVGRPPAELVIEGMKRLDEWNRLAAELPGPKAVFEVDYRVLAERLAEIPDEVNGILRLCDGVRTVMQVVEASALPDLDALTALIRLRDEGIIYDVSSGRVDPAATGDEARLGSGVAEGSAPFPTRLPFEGTARLGAGSAPVQQSFADRLQAEAWSNQWADPPDLEVSDTQVGAPRRRTDPGIGGPGDDVPGAAETAPPTESPAPAPPAEPPPVSDAVPRPRAAEANVIELPPELLSMPLGDRARMTLPLGHAGRAALSLGDSPPLAPSGPDPRFAADAHLDPSSVRETQPGLGLFSPDAAATEGGIVEVEVRESSSRRARAAFAEAEPDEDMEPPHEGLAAGMPTGRVTLEPPPDDASPEASPELPPSSGRLEPAPRRSLDGL